MPHYMYLFRPKRPDFHMTMTSEEKAVMARHTNYLSGMFASGKLVLNGPCLDGTYGINIFAADSPEAARDAMERDPAVQAGIVDAEVHPFHISFLQGRPPSTLNS